MNPFRFIGRLGRQLDEQMREATEASLGQVNLLWRMRRIDEWLFSRPWRIVLLGAPALLAVGLALLVAIMVLFSLQRRDVDQRYTRMTQRFLATGRFEEARVTSLHELLRASNDRDRAEKTFYLGLALGGLGRKDEAVQLFNLAAPLDKPGCPEAQILTAQSLLSSTNVSTAVIRTTPLNATNATTETLRLAERHLLNALAADPQSLPANELLGRLYINTHNPVKAQKYLTQIYSARPEVALLLALSCVQQNDQVNAVLWADRAINAYEQNLIKFAPKYNPADRLGLVQSLGVKQLYAPQRDAAARPVAKTGAGSGTNAPPQDSPAFWISMVRLLLANGKFEPALQTLEQQMAVNSNAVYSAAIADVCAAWAGQIAPRDKDGTTLRLQLLEKGLAYEPQHLRLQLLLAEATHATDDTSAAAKKLLEESMAGATGEAAAWWHFVLWTDARIRGDLPTARQHLQAAYKLAPDNPQILNDLAMDLSSGSHDDQERALKLIQSLLDKYPNQSGFRDTRGQILANLGRYQDAVADLEYSIPRLGNPVSSQKILQKCYTALGRKPSVPQAHVAVLLDEVRDLVIEQKYAEALEKLEKAMHENPNPACASAIADTCVTWIKRIPVAQSDKRLQLIQKGLTYLPEQPELKQMLVQAADAPGASGLAAKSVLNQLVAGAAGDAAANWHLSLGQDAHLRGDLATARTQLETAYEIAPSRTEIKAELATILLGGNHDDWDRALPLIQSALDEFPDNPEYRNVRGLLLAKLGQYKDAAADLEAAAAGLPNPKETRLALAKVYDALGKTKQAEEQRREAQ